MKEQTPMLNELEQKIRKAIPELNENLTIQKIYELLKQQNEK